MIKTEICLFFLTIQIEFNLKIPITLAGLNFPVMRTNSKRPFLFGRSFECCLSKSHLLSMHPNPCYYMMRIWIWHSTFFINSNWIQPESFHFIGRPYFVHIRPNFFQSRVRQMAKYHHLFGSHFECLLSKWHLFLMRLDPCCCIIKSEIWPLNLSLNSTKSTHWQTFKYIICFT